MHPPMQASCESYWCNPVHKARLCIWNQGSPVPPSAHSSSPPTLLRLSSTPRGLPEVYSTHGAPLMWAPSPPGSALPPEEPTLPESPLGGGPAGSKAEAGPKVKPQEGSPQERRVRCHGHCECQEITRERVGQDFRAKEEGAAQEQNKGSQKGSPAPRASLQEGTAGPEAEEVGRCWPLGKNGSPRILFFNPSERLIRKSIVINQGV